MKTLVRPRLEYCSSIWSPKEQVHIKKPESVQKRAARFVLNRPYRRNDPVTRRDSVSAMVKELGWETLETRRKKSSVTLLYKVVNCLVAVPVYYHPVPWNTPTRHNAEHSFNPYQPSIDAFKNSFMPRTVLIWNVLPVAVAMAPTVDLFKVGLAAVTL